MTSYIKSMVLCLYKDEKRVHFEEHQVIFLFFVILPLLLYIPPFLCYNVCFNRFYISYSSRCEQLTPPDKFGVMTNKERKSESKTLLFNSIQKKNPSIAVIISTYSEHYWKKSKSSKTLGPKSFWAYLLNFSIIVDYRLTRWSVLNALKKIHF